MEKKSKRGLDVFNERALQPYLDAVYRELGFEFDRVETQELQLQGVDLVIRHQGAEYPIDEKGQTHYINKRLKTFAFELEFRGSKGMVQEGWLFDDKKVTSHYFLVADIRSDDGRVSGLTSFRLVSVHRKSLIAFLEENQWTQSFITEDVPMMMGRKREHVLSVRDPAVKLIRTHHLVERPLNLVIRLDDLIAAGVAKELVPGRKGMRHWKEVFRQVSCGRKPGTNG